LAGIWRKVIIHAKADAQPIRNSTEAVISHAHLAVDDYSEKRRIKHCDGGGFAHREDTEGDAADDHERRDNGEQAVSHYDQ
jgi:hypothetical protein